MDVVEHLRESGSLAESSELRQQSFGSVTIGGNATAQLGDHFGDKHYHVHVSAERDKNAEQNLFRILHASLAYDGIGSRFRNVATAAPKTCTWVFDTSQYREWIRATTQADDKRPMLYVSGKPGTGKSTVMKAIAKQIELTETPNIMLTNFFSARSKFELDKNILGLYRNLVYHLVAALVSEAASRPNVRDRGSYIPDIQVSFVRQFQNKVRNGAVTDDWTQTELRNFLIDIFSRSKNPATFILIDALDECESSGVQEMVLFFNELQSHAAIAGNPLRVCLSSRPYPHVELPNCLTLTLEKEIEHDRSIRLYTAQKLVVTNYDEAEMLRNKICEKSQGIFLWAVLVIPSVNDMANSGTSVHSMLDRLERTPEGLHEVYSQSLNKNADKLDATLTLYKWVLCSQRSLSDLELYTAVQFSVNSSNQAAASKHIPSELELERYIRGCSHGLVQVRTVRRRMFSPHAKPTREVEFIHESVREFLLGFDAGTYWSQTAWTVPYEDVPETIDTSSAWPRLFILFSFVLFWLARIYQQVISRKTVLTQLSIDVGRAHSEIARICEHYLLTAMPVIHSMVHQHASDSDEEYYRETPLLAYASSAVLYYVNLVIFDSCDSQDLIKLLLTQKYRPLLRLLDRRAYTRDTYRFRVGDDYRDFEELSSQEALLFLLVELDLQQVLKFVLAMPDLNEHGAFAYNSNPAHGGSDFIASALEEAVREEEDALKPSSGTVPEDDLVKANIFAVSIGQTESMKLLLDSGVNIDAASGAYTALGRAVFKRQDAAIDLLLHRGANVNAVATSDGYDFSPLVHAVMTGQEDVCQTLLDAGADINYPLRGYGNILQVAISYHNNGMISWLLKHGADPLLVCGDHENALQAAVARHYYIARKARKILSHVISTGQPLSAFTNVQRRLTDFLRSSRHVFDNSLQKALRLVDTMKSDSSWETDVTKRGTTVENILLLLESGAIDGTLRLEEFRPYFITNTASDIVQGSTGQLENLFQYLEHMTMAEDAETSEGTDGAEWGDSSEDADSLQEADSLEQADILKEADILEAGISSKRDDCCDLRSLGAIHSHT